METLRHAPITEAVFDIRVDFGKVPEITDIESVYPEVESEFPVKELTSVFQASFGIAKGLPQSRFHGQPNGFLFKSQDGQRIIQMRLDGYTFNKLKPYDNWEAFRDEARRYWELYAANTKPTGISRIALRYINRFELPLPIEDIEKYLSTGPKVSGQISHTLEGFFLRFEIADTDADNKAIISVIRDQSQPSPTTYAVIVDIDTFQILDGFPSQDDLSTRFESIRQFKNEVFFNSLTDETIDFFR